MLLTFIMQQNQDSRITKRGKIFCNETPLCPKNGGTYFIQGDFENIRAGGTSRILLSLHYSLTDALYH